MRVFAVDVGNAQSTAWVERSDAHGGPVNSGWGLESLVQAVAQDPAVPIAIGLEGPLFLPSPSIAHDVSMTRRIDKGAPGYPTLPWNVGAGAYAMGAAALALSRVLRALTGNGVEFVVTTSLEKATDEGHLLIWEAFVSREAKRDRKSDHCADAAVAAWAFQNQDCEKVETSSGDRIALSSDDKAAIINVPQGICANLGLRTDQELFNDHLVVRPRSKGPAEIYEGLTERDG